MNFMKILVCLIGLIIFSVSVNAAETKQSSKKDNLKLNTLKIKGSKELPKGLYIVPWQEVKKKKGVKTKQRLVLHSLYGDLFDPVNSSELIIKRQ